MGAESYALYLIHLPLMVVAARIFPRFGLHPLLLAAVMIGASIVASKLIYRFYEAPILRRWERRGRQSDLVARG